MSKILSLLIVLSVSDYCRLGRIDFCSKRHVIKLFSKAGESGFLAARHISSRGSSVESCHAEIVTCPSCAIAITFTYLNLSCNCGSGLESHSYNSCRSDHVRLTEPLYEHTSQASFCGIRPGPYIRTRQWEYKSKTRSVRVSLFYSRPYVHAFTIDYRSEPNRQLLVGSSRYRPEANLTAGVISSPFFPAAYPRDIVIDYTLTCKMLPPFPFPLDANMSLEDDFDCRIHLLFTDFQLAAASSLQFYEGGRRVHSVNGNSLGPPVFFSSASSLTVRFLASGHSSAGFRAVFSFVSANFMNKMVTPLTDCGGLVHNFGGTVTMVNMTDSQIQLYYCIWLIQPRRNFRTAKSYLYLKVTAFLHFAGDAELQIRQGLTSESPLLEILRFPVVRSSHEHVIPVRLGCYVSLRALFGPASHFALTYAGFSLDNCFSVSEFLCQNFRCISKKLTCDGFDHCGDNSDETDLCRQGTFDSDNAKFPIPPPNFHFPKIKEFSTSLVFLGSLATLFFLILTLVSVIQKIEYRSRRQSAVQDQLRTFSDLWDSLSMDPSMEDIFIDDPPSYDPPPNYEDVVKMDGSETCAYLSNIEIGQSETER